MASGRADKSKYLDVVAGCSVGKIWAPTAVALGGGAWAGLHFSLWIPALIGLSCLAMVLILAARRAKREVVARGAGLVLVAATGVWLGWHSQVQSPPLDLPMPQRQAPVHEGLVHSDPAWTPLGYRFEMRWLRRCPPPAATEPCFAAWGTLRVDVRGRVVQVRRGDRIRIAGFVSPPPAYRNPGAFDLTASWHHQQLWGALHVAHSGKLAIMERSVGPIDGLLARIAQWRRQLALRVAAVLPEQQAVIVNAMALGDRSSSWPQLDRWLRDTGTAHIVAVSGSHLAVAVGGMRWLVRTGMARLLPGLLRTASLAVWTFIPLILATWAYTALTGWAAATVRAAWMVSALLLAEAATRRAPVWELLGFACVILVVVDPASVDDLGVQLSVAGVIGLIWGASEPLAATLGPKRNAVRMAWRSAVGAWATTTPICALRLGQVAWVSAPINLLMAAYAAALLPICLAVAGLAALDQHLATVAATWLSGAALWPWLQVVAATDQLFPVGAVHGAAAAAVAVWAVAVGGAVLSAGPWLRRSAVAGIAVAVVAIWQRQAAKPANESVRVTFFDVGHGDSAVVETGDGRIWLVDGGGEVGDNGRVGDLAVVPALRAIGVQGIDRMILTHAHPDHENGLLAVARALPVGQFWFNGQAAAGAEHAELMRLLHAARSPVPFGTSWTEGPVRVRVVSPNRPTGPFVPTWDHNDNSLVIEIAVGTSRLLLTGDIETKAEAELAQTGAVGPVAVLKAPHHGSHTSSTPPLLNAVSPRLAIASARPWGQLAFPHADVRARYRQRHIPLWSTADGAITVTLTTSAVRVEQQGRFAQWPTSAAPEIAAR